MAGIGNCFIIFRNGDHFVLIWPAEAVVCFEKSPQESIGVNLVLVGSQKFGIGGGLDPHPVQFNLTAKLFRKNQNGGACG